MTAEIIEFTQANPVEQLEEVKETLTKQIASKKLLLGMEKKKLAAIQKLNVEVVTDKKEKIDEQFAVVTKCMDELAALEVDFKDLNRTRDDETEEKIQQALGVVANSWLPKHDSAGYIMGDEQFVYIEDFSTVDEKQNVLLNEMTPRAFSEMLAADLGIKSWHLPAPRLKDLFNDHGKSYRMMRYSIDEQKWNKNIYLPIHHMERHFISNMAVEGDHSEFFDCLMHSLSGGKKENQDHIEQWILHKIINFTKAVTTPDIVIVGHVGGNGKGIIQAIIRMMLPATLSGKANSKTLNGNFNAIMLGKLIVFFDDQNSKEIPLEVVKQLAGSDTMIFEPKGKDQYEGEKTHSSAWFSQVLPFELTAAGKEGGVDRRFSVMRTNITFLESLRKHMSEKYGTEVNIEESKDLAEKVVSEILLNRVEIAKWFNYISKKHSMVTKDYTLKPLHGEDYKYFLARQQSSFDKIWDDLVMPEMTAGRVVPIFVIKELVRHLENKQPSDKFIVTRLKEIAAQNKIEIDFDRRAVTLTSKVGKNEMSKKKQCSFVKQADHFADHPEFMWSNVSNLPYDTVIGAREVIDEDNLVFGSSSIH